MAFLRPRWWGLPLVIFGVARVVDTVALLLLPAVNERTGSAWDDFLSRSTNWDANWYATIAHSGYPGSLPVGPDGAVVQNSWAFFPLFPVLTRAAMEATSLTFAVCGVAISILCGAAAVLTIYRVLERAAGRGAGLAAVIGLCAYPASPVLQMPYTESLALLLLCLAILFLSQRQYGRLTLTLIPLGLARGIMPAFGLLIAARLVMEWRRMGSERPAIRQLLPRLLPLLTSALLCLLWPVTSAIVTGRADALTATERSWGSYSWLAAVSHGPHAALYTLVALVALAAFAIIALKSTAWPTEWRLWSVIYPLFIFAATPPATAVVRYLLLSGVVAYPFWGRVDTDRRLRTILVAGCAMIGLILQMLWLKELWLSPVAGHEPP